MLFEVAQRDVTLTTFKIIRSFKELYKDEVKKPKVSRLAPIFNKEMAWSFFDGASQGSEGCCGASMILYLDERHFFLLELGATEGSNTHVELLALWGLLFFANSKGLSSLQIARDSRVVINWFLGVSELSSIVLERWKRNI